MNLDKLNSATKYPSIPTYHRLGDRGVPTSDVQVDFSTERDLVFTEKIDGTNSRVILIGDDYYIGSREELLTAWGDRIANPALGIVDAVRDIAARAPDTNGEIRVLYLETFGGKVTAASKEYTSNRAVSVRLFDVALVPSEVFSMEREEIAAWRDDGGQHFMDEFGLRGLAEILGVELAPRLSGPDALPTDPAAVLPVLREVLPKSRVMLDPDASGRGEGIVVRTRARSKIAKLRFEDYARLTKARK